MCKKFFVVFSNKWLINPKLYVKFFYVNKQIEQNKDCEFKQFLLQQEAQAFLKSKKLELKAYKLKAQTIQHKSQASQTENITKQNINKSNVQLKKRGSYQNKFEHSKTRQQTIAKCLETLFRKDRRFKDIIQTYQFKVHQTKEKIDPIVTYKSYTLGTTLGNPGNSSVSYYYIDNQSKLVLKHYQTIGIRFYQHSNFLAIIFSLIDAYCNGIKKIIVYGHKVVVNHLKQIYQLKDSHFHIYKNLIQRLQQMFSQFKIQKIQTKLNPRAEYLCYSAFSQQNLEQRNSKRHVYQSNRMKEQIQRYFQTNKKAQEKVY